METFEVMGSAQELRPHLGEVGKRYLAPAIYALSASLVILGSVKCDLGIVGVHGLFAEGAFARSRGSCKSLRV